MKHVLQIAQGRLKGLQLDLKEGKTILGRDEGCDLLVDHESVSRQHAEFIREGDRVLLRDLGSLNSVHINGKPTMEHHLQDGDQVLIGQVEFHYYLTVEGGGPVFDPHKRLWSATDVSALSGVGILFLIQFLFLIILTGYWDPRTAMAVLVEPDAALTNQVAEVETAVNDPVAETLSTDPDAQDMAERGEESGSDAVETADAGDAEDTEMDPDDVLAKSRAERMLEQALVLRDEKRILGEAERQLKRIQQMDPNFLAAYVELARLYQLRGSEDLAKPQWEQVVRRGKNTPLYNEAADALKKIERNEKMAAYARNFSRAAPPIPDDVTPPAPNPRTPVAAPTPKPTPVAEVAVKVRMADVKRYPASETYDEMRLLNVTLEVKSSAQPAAVNGKDIMVRVKFYDQDQDSLRIFPSEVLIAQPEASLDGRVSSSDTPAVTFSYVVQRGYRAVEEKRIGKKLGYYGYIVEVFYKGKRVDSWVMPSALKKFNR